MRLFVDSYVSKLRTELALLAADLVVISTTILFATAALEASAATVEVLLLVAWSCFPRASAKILCHLGKPSSLLMSVGLYGGIIALVGLLMATGWDLIQSLQPERSVDELLTLVLVLAWGSGFALSKPPFYRLFDLFTCASMMLAIKAGQPHSQLWVPLFLFALFLSASIRHMYHNVFRARQNSPFNLQNTRVVALVGACCAAFVFIGVALVIGNGRFPTVPRQASTRDTLHRRLGARVEPHRNRPAFSGRGGQAAPLFDEESRDESSNSPVAREFTYRVNLKDLSKPDLTRGVVLGLWSRDGKAPWPPPRDTLWKGLTFSTYDPATEAWEEPGLKTIHKWSGEYRYEDKAPENHVFDVTVTTPVFQSFVIPYNTTSIHAAGISQYELSQPGSDVFPVPPLSSSSVYAIEHAPAGLTSLASRRDLESIDARYLAVPSVTEVGIDLQGVADRVLDANAPATANLAALRAYFSNDFAYSNQAKWKHRENALYRFMEETRLGNCTYFSTATALLLRSVKIPTRLAVGFIGGRHDESTNQFLILNETAHAWVEVADPERGWIPVDPTTWVDSIDAPTDLGQPSVTDLRADLAAGDAPGGRDAADGASQPDAGTERADGLAATGEEQDQGQPADVAPFLEPDGEQRASEFKPFVIEVERPSELSDESYAMILDRDRGEADSESSYVSTGESPRLRRVRHFTLPDTLRTYFRASLIVLAILLIGLVTLFHLRPPKKKPGEDEEEEDEEEDLDRIGGLTTLEAEPIFTSDPRGRILTAYYQLQRILELTRSHRRPHQTPIEHARRVVRSRPELEKDFLQVHRVFYRMFYGEQEPTESDADAVERGCRRLRRALG